MALDLTKVTTEFESSAGSGISQALARAETLVPGAGREAIEVLAADAMFAQETVEAQTDRIVVEGAVRCQAVYRQGDGITLRAVSAQTTLSHVFDMPGVAPGMTARACGQVEHVEARYENGHMIFLVTVSISAQAFRLTPLDIITGVSGSDDIEMQTGDICTCRITADTRSVSSVRNETALPAALDARTSLMECGEAWIESCEPDLGGVRVKGRINAETLISSGVEGRPAASVRNVIDFDQLVEVPEWLAGDVCAEACIKRLDTRVEQGGEREDSVLITEADIDIQVTSMARECINAVTDAYSTAGPALSVSGDGQTVCVGMGCMRCAEQVKGTLLLSENAPGVGSVISVCVHPNISGWSTNSESMIEGILEATVLYLPGGSDRVASARSEMPFSVKCPGTLNDLSMVCLRVLSAEASTLMSDRVELKCQLGVTTFTRDERHMFVAEDISEGDMLKKRPGVIMFWPSQDDSLWTVGKRYNVSQENIKRMNRGAETVEAGKAMIIKI